MSPDLKAQIDRAPVLPGVYVFRNKDGRILYVGKAKSLKDRLKSYLNPIQDERPSVSLLVPQIHAVEWILTDTEKEALILENSLIKEHRPRYNIMLRDDKSYVSLRLTNHEFPRLFVTRKIVRDKSTYFGPYSSAYDLRQTLKLIQKIFQIRDCADSFYENRSRPCLQHEIRRCTAPCVGKVTKEQYAEQVREASSFLKGDKERLIGRLKADMGRASDRMKYEAAAALRDRIRAVEETLEPQKMESRDSDRNVDAIGMAGDASATLVKVLKVRAGRMTGADEFFIAEPISAAREIARAFLQQYYFADVLGRDPPPQLLIGHPISDDSSFEDLLSDRAGRRVHITRPQRGFNAKLLKLANRNAAASIEERKRKSVLNQDLLEELKRRLHLKKFPRRIEGYDISNIQGTEPYGSLVTFVDGEPDKNGYRYYRIRTIKGSNDFAMLRETFERRFRKMDDENRPDFILVDGGKGQLKQLTDVLKELAIVGIDVASIAKEKELRSRSGKKYAPERIFLPGQKNPLIFEPSAPILHLLQRVRDEAHRFGITRHRRARGKKAVESVLGRIPGIGPTRQRALILALRTLEAIQKAPVADLTKVKGMSTKAAESVFSFFRTSGRPKDEP